MVRVRRPVRGIHVLDAISRICHDHTYVRHEASGKPATDVVGGLVDELSRLGWIRVVDEEKSETIVCIHDLNLLELIIPFQGYCVKRNVCVLDAFDLGWANKFRSSLVIVEAGCDFRSRNDNFEEVERGIFPDSCISLR